MPLPNKTLTGGADHHIQVWEIPGDNLLDRFTVAIRYPDGYHALFGMSYGGTAFNQFLGEVNDSEPYPGMYELGPHLGKLLTKTPNHLRDAIAGRMVESVQAPKADVCRCCENDNADVPKNTQKRA